MTEFSSISTFLCVTRASSTHFGSQCAIRKSKLMRVTNMSVSRRISCTLGGGSAIANPTMPIKGGADFLWLNVNCGLKRHSNNTTCVRACRNTKLTCDLTPLPLYVHTRETAYTISTNSRRNRRIAYPIARRLLEVAPPFRQGGFHPNAKRSIVTLVESGRRQRHYRGH